jgi:toxin FitB
MMSGMVLDTNVLSELMRPSPDARVVAWFAGRAETGFLITAITRAEIMLGIELLPPGRRKEALAEAAGKMFNEEFGKRCLPFDEPAADLYAGIVAERTRAGQPISTEDAQIAAIALAQGLPLATRNTRDFANIKGLRTVDPWHDD